MKLFLSTCLLLIINILSCQVNFYSCNGNGSISILSTFDCSEETYSGFPPFLDIAITPNKTLFGIDNSLFKIDYMNNSYTTIGQVLDINNRSISGVGLVALDDNFLLIDFNDSLFKIDVTTAIAYPVGKIGYFCAGDFAFFNDTLYLADVTNHLIKIILNPSKTAILNVKDIGQMNTNFLSVLSLFTTYLSCNVNEKGLFAIDGNKVYRINVQNASANYVCSMLDTTIQSFGAASIYDFESEKNVNENIPNVFTPNGDNVNDNFKFLDETKTNSDFSIIIFNRWGEIVFESNDLNFLWNGSNKLGEQLTNGIYYYISGYTNSCSESKTLNGFITLFK